MSVVNVCMCVCMCVVIMIVMHSIFLRYMCQVKCTSVEEFCSAHAFG